MGVSFDTFDLEYAILCDDIRREDNGKLILIGVYANSILLPSFPFVMNFKLLFRIVPKTPGQFPLNLSFRLGSNERVVLKGNIESAEMEPETTQTPDLILHFAEPADLTFEVNADRDISEQGWKKILVMPVLAA